jgi:NAD(P)H dehydrogenase (quinone)
LPLNSKEEIMFAILGAAGKIGYSTAKALREAGVPVRAVLRNASKADRLGAIGCDVAFADLQDAKALVGAIAGADSVHIILPADPRAEDIKDDMRRSIESIAQALEEARPALVLAISDYGAHLGEGFSMPSMFYEFEQRLRRLDMRKIFLRSAEHMEGWGRVAPVAIETGILPSFHDPVEKRIPNVSAQDVGRIAADLLLRPDIETQEQIVHAEGPRRYSASDVAAALGELSGRAIVAQALPRSLWRESLGRMMSASTADLLTELYDVHSKGLIDVEPNAGDIRKGTTELIEALRSLVARQ